MLACDGNYGKQSGAAADAQKHVAQCVVEAELRVSTEVAVGDELREFPEHGGGAGEGEDHDSVRDAMERTDDGALGCSE